MYLRGRGAPPNSNTPKQLAVRAALSALATQWATVATDTQRTDWATWASLTPRTNAIGNSFNMSGQQAFIGCNTPRTQAGLPEVFDGPTTPGLADSGVITVTAAAGTPGTLSVAYDNTMDWANDDDGALLVYASKPQLATINFFKGPYYLADLVAGDSMTPPTSPATVTLADAGIAGMRVYFRIFCSNADGRWSTDTLGFATIA